MDTQLIIMGVESLKLIEVVRATFKLRGRDRPNPTTPCFAAPVAGFWQRHAQIHRR